MYKLIGEDELECKLISDEKADWFPEPPSCERNYCEPMVSNEVESFECVETISSSLLQRAKEVNYIAETDVCKITCKNDTYKVVGEEIAVCQHLGVWSHEPYCQKLLCL